MTDSVRIIARDVFGANQWTEWTQPQEILTAHSVSDVAAVIKRVEQANAESLSALGFVTYEAGCAFDERFRTIHQHTSLPYAWFALFKTHQDFTPQCHNSSQSITWTPTEDLYVYREKIARIKEHIASGETYQVNHTFQLESKDSLDADGLFEELYRRQPSPYAMLIETPDFSIISISPELFFRVDGETITCKPMKGTCPRGLYSASDKAQGQELKNSQKNRAENVMITDMVRNDLGRIPNARAIAVDELFEVTAWPTLWQMTSTVTAQTDAGLYDIFKELFPSASITGAPKLQTSSIIAELEDRPRGLYTGAVGWSLPDRNAQFAVAIRTAVQDNRTGITQYGIGSGIVWDSEADNEYDECVLKAKLLNKPENPFSILETIRWDREKGYRFLESHLNRLASTATFFGFPLNREDAAEKLNARANTFSDDHVRVRLLANCNGDITIEHSPLDTSANYDDPASALVYTARIDKKKIPVDSPFLFHKTTNRRFYDDARARNTDVDEVLLINTRNEAMEFSTGNLVIRRGDEWLTSAVSSGLLAGIFRDHLIQTQRIKEAVISLDDIKTADDIYFINSVRGWIKIKLTT